MLTIADYSDEAKYNIKTVSQKTGIEPVTLRAWERRYQILTPKRAANGYRLYSERDTVLLIWLKNKIESGLAISSAVADYRLQLKKGVSPEAVVEFASPILSKLTQASSSEIVKQLFSALISRDEIKASQIFEEARSSFNLIMFFEKIVSPVLQEIGEAWYHNKIQVATEHFASSLIRAKLMAIFQSMQTQKNKPYVMVGSAPGELHEIGILMLSILLRDSGYRVEYLGPDLPMVDLALYAKDEHPKMIILSATLNNSIGEMTCFENLLKGTKHTPLFGFGGPAFNRHPEWIEKVQGIFLGFNFIETMETINTLLNEKKNG